MEKGSLQNQAGCGAQSEGAAPRLATRAMLLSSVPWNMCSSSMLHDGKGVPWKLSVVQLHRTKIAPKRSEMI